MGFGLGSLMKMAKGGLGIDELGEMLSAAGIEMEFKPIAISKGAPAFRELAQAASLPEAHIITLQGKLKTGDSISAILVVSQKSNHGQKKIPAAS